MTYKVSLRNVRKCHVLSCSRGCFPRFWVSRIYCRRLVLLFSMVCVEGSGWAGVTLPDKVAVFRWILFVFVGDGPADRAGHGLRGNARKDMSPRMATRHVWRRAPRGAGVSGSRGPQHLFEQQSALDKQGSPVWGSAHPRGSAGWLGRRVIHSVGSSGFFRRF